MSRLILGDCREVMATLDADSIDAIVTDPPYGLSFMGKGWDHGVPGEEFWREAARVAKPGAHLVAFGGTRTYHRLACAIEDAGWEIRDCLSWIYGSGFPKSLDVSKAIDKAAGEERSRYARAAFGGTFSDDDGTTYGTAIDNTPISDATRQWDGWGTALKPAWEPIILARKPLDGTVAANVLEHGTGALNVDGCRIGTEDTRGKASKTALGVMNDDGWQAREIVVGSASGRWPANLILDEEAARILDEQSAGASRFFYCAKASRKDRGDNKHPTVKPTDLMRWLVRLVTPPGGIVLDPFMGSGSTGKAAKLEGFEFVGIEKEAEYLAIADERIAATVFEPVQLTFSP